MLNIYVETFSFKKQKSMHRNIFKECGCINISGLSPCCTSSSWPWSTMKTSLPAISQWPRLHRPFTWLLGLFALCAAFMFDWSFKMDTRSAHLPEKFTWYYNFCATARFVGVSNCRSHLLLVQDLFLRFLIYFTVRGLLNLALTVRGEWVPDICHS